VDGRLQRRAERHEARLTALRPLAIAYAIGLVPALAVAIGQPVWSRVDEPAHYDVIAQYAAGVYPHDSVTTIRPETLAIMRKTGNYGFVVDNAYQLPDGFATMPTGLTDAEHVLWVRRHVWQYSYEAFQPPLYYALAVPAWKLGDLVGGAFGALYAVRVFDALIAALLAPLAMLLALRLSAEPAVGWGAAVLTAAMPGVDLNLTSVTNDVLVSVLGAATLLVAIGGRVTVRRALLAGVLLGLAVLAKTTAVGLVPAVVAALWWRGQWKPALTGMAATAVIVLPWLLSNVAIYGEVVTTKEQLAMSAFPARTGALDFWSVSSLHSFVTFWSGDPFLSLSTAVPLALVAALLCALAIAGLLRAPRSRELVIVVLAAIGAGLVSLTSPILAAFNAPGRLAYVGLTAVTALVAVGLALEMPSWRLRRGAIAVYAALGVIGLAVLAYPQSTAPAGAGHPVIAHSSALNASGSFGRLSIDLQTCVVDPEGNVLLGLLIENFGASPAEWSQTAEIRQGGETRATSDYARGTPFPLAFQPGFQVTGWLWFGARDRVPTTGQVRFNEIATNDYRSIGDIVIPTPLC
jgi:4-amino-4-deoxy-L-arabinose transferase-like glycosyltransferase